MREFDVTLDPERLFSALFDDGVEQFAGVPCSILDPLLLELERGGRDRYLPASVEGEAVAAAAGAWLGGSFGGVLLQNSGLGNAINPLASLALPYRIPMVLIVSWRGEPEKKDALHHVPMGEATPRLLELFGISATILREGADVEKAAHEAVAMARETRRPTALIVPRGSFGEPSVARSEIDRAKPLARRPCAAEIPTFGGAEQATRKQVLEAWLKRGQDARIIATTGYMSRMLSDYGEWDRHFPMQGSMGFAAAVALGVSRASSDEPVCILDGDGALLMRLGSLATIGAAAPRSLVHVVLDNAGYISTGGQASVSPGVDFASVARACGYPRTAICSGVDGLEEAMDWVRVGFGRGPSLLHLAIDRHEAKSLQRPTLAPNEIADCFRAAQLRKRRSSIESPSASAT